MSSSLYDLVYLVVHGERPTSDICIQAMYTLDGFLLLQNYDKLLLFLELLEAGTLRDELLLLVDGFLGDHEPLSSFGYQNLFEKGHITLERWRSIQSSLIENDLDMIEEGVQAAINEEETLRSKHQQKVSEILVGDGCSQNVENRAEQRCQDNPQGQHPLDTRVEGSDFSIVYTGVEEIHAEIEKPRAEMKKASAEIEDMDFSIMSASTTNIVEPTTTAPRTPFHDTLRDWNLQSPSTNTYWNETPSTYQVHASRYRWELWNGVHL